MKLCVVGAGYAGLVSGVCLAEKGHQVICVDLDADKVARINEGKTPIYEEGLEALLRRNVGKRLVATTDLGRSVLASDLTMIAVGTPTVGTVINLDYVLKATREIGAALKQKDDYHVVVVKSTVIPGTTDGPVREALEQSSGKRAGEDFGLGMNPEFLTEGLAVRDFMGPDRIVLGGLDDRTRTKMAELYAEFTGVPVVPTNNKTAEMIKYVSNTVLATLISFSNDFANLCTQIGGIDTVDVVEGVRRSQYFTSVTPDGTRIEAPIAAFLEAGCGFGGSCLGKDTRAISSLGASVGQPMSLLEQVIEINDAQPSRMIDILKSEIPDLAGTPIAVLGLAFKPDTDDIRESPAVPILKALLKEGAVVTAYDPVATANMKQVVPDVTYAPGLPEALQNAAAAIVVTRWDEFKAVPDLLNKTNPDCLVIDGRRMLDKRSVRRYRGIGLRE